MKYLIDFADEATSQEIADWLTANDITEHRQMNALKNVFIVECTSTPAKTDLVESVVVDENISNQLLSTVEIIPAATNSTGTFEHDAEWWKTATAYEIDFNATESTFERRGAKTTVYMVDSGVNSAHPDFKNAKIEHLFSFNGDAQDTNGHGTALASVIVGDTLGITSSTLKSVKIFDSTKTTMTSDIVSAIDAMLQDILASSCVNIVNMSWSIPKNEYIEQKIQELRNAGAFVAVAAGNSGTAIQDVTPASMENVLTIGAYTEDFVPADFSNYTSDIKNTPDAINYGALDGWAPGVNIKAAMVDGSFGTIAGTSVATAIAVACLAYNSDSFYSNIGVPAQIDWFLNKTTLIKNNMLTLSDKYSASVNTIVSFFAKAAPTWVTGKYNVARLAYDNMDIMGFLVPSAYLSKVELDGDLPEGLSLSNGWLVGRLANAPETTEKLKYTITATFTTGEVNTFNFTLYLAKGGTPAGDYPEDITPAAVDGYCSYNCENLACEGVCMWCDKGVCGGCNMDCR